MKQINYFEGVPVVFTDAITKEVRRRTHRKKRIDKKWLKRYGYREVTDHSKVLVFNNTLYMSKQCYEKLGKAWERKMGGKA